MFGDKCPRCNSRVKKKFEFCPSCGLNLNSGNNQDYGFLGKNDDFDMKMPFGFNMLFKPLLKELQKQMMELDKEIKKDTKSTKGRNHTTFSIHIKTPGSKPMKFESSDFGAMPLSSREASDSKEQTLMLPRISREHLDKVKNHPRKEPETNIRRLADKIIYELSLPRVNSLSKVNIRKLDTALEVKAISEKEVYIKSINITLPLINFYLASEKLVLEFANE